MVFAGQVVHRSRVGGYGHRIVLGYFALAIIALFAAYFASSAPGVTEGELAIATIFP